MAARHRAARLLVTFPGQGSQRLGMAQDVAGRHAVARAVLDEVDAALGGEPRLSAVMSGRDMEALTLTRNCQPALMAHSVAVWRVLEAMLGRDVLGRATGAMMGHSLGEYTALVCAGALGLSDAARLLRARGEAMQRAVSETSARTKMEAVVLRPGQFGALRKLVESQRPEPPEMIAVANINSATQATLSGTESLVDYVVNEARTRKIISVAKKLPVSAPFHSPLMASAARVVKDMLDAIEVREPTVPLYANTTGERMPTDPAAIKRLLVLQTTSPVLWHHALQRCLAEDPAIRTLVEVGTGKVLTGLARAREGLELWNVDTAADIDRFCVAFAEGPSS